MPSKRSQLAVDRYLPARFLPFVSEIEPRSEGKRSQVLRCSRPPRGRPGSYRAGRLRRTDAADMLKTRLKQAGLPAHYSPHTFRAIGITNFLENDGTLEAAQRIAGHARQPNHETL